MKCKRTKKIDKKINTNRMLIETGRNLEISKNKL